MVRSLTKKFLQCVYYYHFFYLIGNISNLTLSVPSKSADYIVIQWEHYQESDERNLLHYVVHWTETYVEIKRNKLFSIS